MRGYQYNIADELLIDNFAGGGGASLRREESWI